MAATKPLVSPTPPPAPKGICPCCHAEQTCFRVDDEQGRTVERLCCFLCGYGVPPSLWSEQRIGNLFASPKISGWIISAAPVTGPN